MLERVRQFIGRLRAVPTPISDGGRVLPDLSLWAQYQRIGGQLTPIEVSSIIREADGGDTRRLVDLDNEFRQKDAHLQTVLFTREAALSGLAWTLDMPGVRPSSQRGNPQRRLVQDVLEQATWFAPLVAHLTGAVYHGYSVAEIVWEQRGRKLVPGEVVLHSQRRFQFRKDDGRLVWHDHSTNYRDVDFLEEFPGKFVVSQPRVNGDSPAREGLSRLLLWPALFRNWDLSDWLKLAEIAWKPWRLGKYQKGASKQDIDALIRILGQLTTSGVAAYPETVEMQVEWPKGGVDAKATHAELYSLLGAEMSKAVLGQTLTTEQGKVGSQALGNVHDRVRRDILEFDARHVGNVITRDLIAPMIALNFGTNAPVPRLVFQTEDSADMLATAQALEILAGDVVRMKVPASWAHDVLGIPEPSDNEDTLGVAYDVDVSELNGVAQVVPSDTSAPDAAPTTN